MATSAKSINAALPPPEPPGALKWVRDNLLGGWLNTTLTVVSLIILYYAVTGVVRWVFFTADWRPVTEFPLLYAIGQYPRELMWRVGASLSLIVLLLGLSWGKWGGLMRPISVGGFVFFTFFALLPASHPALTAGMRAYLGANALLIAAGYWLGRLRGFRNSILTILWVIAPVITIVLFRGFENFPPLERVGTTVWGGLMVTFVLAVGGILLSFPIGVALALGRRSSLPVVSGFSTLFIEVIRGVPLVTILFMFSIILALFLPPEARLDRLLRALMAMTVFSAAYTAENVRGGLQSVPSGQVEAAKALGMSGVQIMAFIVLPQAIRAVIPAIVGQFISLFKDTTLVVIVGINDFLGIGKSVLNSSPEFVRLQAEVYLFIAIVYMIFSYLMSLASRRIETALGVGTR
jgi:general L-amino acid transport system permease protein